MGSTSPASLAEPHPISDQVIETDMPSAPANTDESPTCSVVAPNPVAGGQPGPAPRSQRLDRGAGSVCPLTEKEQGGEEDQEGAEGREGLGSWRGRLTA